MQQVTGLILAGGRATRMGGLDKGLVEYKGQPLVQHLQKQFQPQCHCLLLNANRNIETYTAMGFSVIKDYHKDFQGPLAGFYSGLMAISTEWMISAPCDGPFLASDYVFRMIQSANDKDALLSVATDNNRLQSVYALIHQSLAPDLAEFLNSKERKIDRWFNHHSYASVDFSDSPKMFININTLEQLTELTQ